jgi:predicted metal-dependent hydrolase
VSYREQFELGIAEFNRGEFFQCHDTFEELWMESRGDRKLFLQGLVQAAVGLFHCMSGNARGAYSQLSRSVEKLTGYRPMFDGVDVDDLVESLETLRSAVAEGLASDSFQFDPGLVPSIAYVPEHLVSPDD